MTKDEIEEVKRFWADEGGDFSATGLRLLEERERLLEALKLSSRREVLLGA